MKKILSIILLVFLTSACFAKEKKYSVDSETYVGKAKSERIRFIILHYTAVNNEVSLRALQGDKVSSHYLILDDDEDKIYNLVPENERAWHAGKSSFGERTNINDTSIGIEIVNEGIAEEYRDGEDFKPYECYVDYNPIQIEKVIQLLKDISERYEISPKNILAHSDIAPTRKTDPGPKFPWEMLAKEHNIGAWYEEEDKLSFMDEKEFNKLSVEDIKNELRKYGYSVNESDEWDKDSMKVVYAFQLHFNPKNVSGEMDLETYAILKALNKKYSD